MNIPSQPAWVDPRLGSLSSVPQVDSRAPGELAQAPQHVVYQVTGCFIVGFCMGMPVSMATLVALCMLHAACYMCRECTKMHVYNNDESS